MKYFLYTLPLFASCFLTTQAFAQIVVSSPSGTTIRGEEQLAKTTEGPNNNAFGNADRLTQGLQAAESSQTKGMQFKNAVLVPGVEYHWMNDSSAGGFAGYEVDATLSLDADVYDGLILGVLYGRAYRETENDIGISQHMNSDSVSLYGAKRFFNLLNVGLAYNYANTRDRLSRAIEYNMNRESHGGTALVGVSDRIGKWNWSTMASFVYVSDEYDFADITDRTSSRFGSSNAIGYDVTKYLTLGASVAYYNFIHQDLYISVPARDDSYWLLGPRLLFYPSDQVTASLNFDSMHGYKDLTSFIVSAGVEINF